MPTPHDHIRQHLARLAEAVNEGRHVAAHDALSDLMTLRARIGMPVSLPAPPNPMISRESQ